MNTIEDLLLAEHTERQLVRRTREYRQAHAEHDKQSIMRARIFLFMALEDWEQAHPATVNHPVDLSIDGQVGTA